MQSERCSPCQGYGWVPTSTSTLYPDVQPCQYCHGRGQRLYEDIDLADLAQPPGARSDETACTPPPAAD